MKKLILRALLGTNIAYADFSMGFARGIHLNLDRLNNNHLFMKYENKSFGVVLFENSFRRSTLAVYKPFEMLSEGNLSVSGKLGLATGYSKKMAYNGYLYTLDGWWFITDNLLLIPVLSLDYKLNENFGVSISNLGNSVSLGLEIKFK